jgi:hypothetical protein
MLYALPSSTVVLKANEWMPYADLAVRYLCVTSISTSFPSAE